jgi:hypothetical protein
MVAHMTVMLHGVPGLNPAYAPGWVGLPSGMVQENQQSNIPVCTVQLHSARYNSTHIGQCLPIIIISNKLFIVPVAQQI